LHYCSYEQIDTRCVSQGSVMTLIGRGEQLFCHYFVAINSGICAPKIIKIQHDLTKLLRKQKGCSFLPHSVDVRKILQGGPRPLP